MERAIQNEHAGSVAPNWLAGIYALGAATLLVSFWLAYETPAAILAAIAIGTYGAFGPLRLGKVLFSRKAASAALNGVVLVVAIVAFVNVVGGATESPHSVLSVPANVTFMLGVTGLAIALITFIGRRAYRLARRVPAVCKSAFDAARLRAALTSQYLRDVYLGDHQ